MAAKVVLVAVPTVLGIASIRVYRVSEAPVDGVTREKLSVYNPVPQSHQFQFVAEKPGTLETGLTTARETLLPIVQAVQGACVSVKNGSINLYHAGEDVYYYLKDPPPGFLPRFGSITMAGLLGMFLARKGSRFKRVAVPVGLMSAGASVCYPAQAVAVLKVTGKKVYAAGQWSSASVSSLFTSKPKEPVAKEPAAPQPQSATVPKPESPVVEEAPSVPCHAPDPSSTADSPAQTTTSSETEVESAEPVPVCDETAAPVITEEPSSITQTQISPDQAPTETTTDTVVESVSAESALDAEEPPAPVGSEEPSASKQTPETPSAEAGPAQDTPTAEPETVVEYVPVESPPPSEEPPAPVESEEPSTAKHTETTTDTVVESVSAESAPASEEPPAPIEEASASKQAPEAPSAEPSPDQTTPTSEPETVVESVPAESAPAPEEPAAPMPSDQPADKVLESADSEPAAEESVEKPLEAAVEEPSTPTHTPPPPPEEAAAENTTGGSGFQAAPALMDFGQSNPEDEDLYSRRS
ncbi:MICOS complex subunit MIC27 [Centroberyx gerrardi]